MGRGNIGFTATIAKGHGLAHPPFVNGAMHHGKTRKRNGCKQSLTHHGWQHKHPLICQTLTKRYGIGRDVTTNKDERMQWLRNLAYQFANGKVNEQQVLKAMKAASHWVPPSEYGEFYLELADVGTSVADSPFMDWVALLDDDFDETWIIQDVWPMGRQLHMHAPRKTGKSLILQWQAACLAIGRDPFTGTAQKPMKTLYLDPESTKADLRSRLMDDMGFKPGELTNLFYALHPPIAKLDTEQGGNALMAWVKTYGIEAVLIDGFPRMVEGEENSSDTYRNFYMHTGYKLKAAGVPYERADNEGYQEGRSRGSSAKADDVDIVWQLKEVQDGLELVRKASRIADLPDSIFIHKRLEPLRFDRGLRSWPSGTKEKAEECDLLAMPLNISRRKAAQAFKDAGLPTGPNNVLQAALNYRKQKGGFP